MENIAYKKDKSNDSITITSNVKYKENIKIKKVFYDVESIAVLCLYSKYVMLLNNMIRNQLDKLFLNLNTDIYKIIGKHLKKYDNIILENAELGMNSHFNILERLEELKPENILIIDSYTGLLKSIVIKYASLALTDDRINFLDVGLNANNATSKKYTDEIKTLFGYDFNFLNEHDQSYSNTYDLNIQDNINKYFKDKKKDIDFIVYRYQPKNMYILNVVNLFSNILLVTKILKVGGNAIIVIPRLIYLNKIIKQVLYCLSLSFANLTFYYTPTTILADSYFMFSGYLGNNNDNIKILNNVLNELNKINPEGGNNINFKTEYLKKKYGIISDWTNDKSYDTIIYNLLNFDYKSTSFKSFLNKISDVMKVENKMNKKYKQILFNKLIIKSEEQIIQFIENHIKNSLNYSINYCKRFGLPVNPIYISNEETYEKKILDETITMPRNLIMNLLDYETIIDKKYNFKVGNTEYTGKQVAVITQENKIKGKPLVITNLKYDDTHIYEMPNFKKILGELNIYKIAIDARRGYDRYGKVIVDTKGAAEEYRQVTMFINLPRGIIYYIKNNLHVTVTRAFIKMHEILYEFNLIDFNSVGNNIKTFHTCELPGHFINATNYFIKSNKPNMVFDWHANSLNPNDETNKIKYGQEIFGDQYGFMEKYKDRWLFGKDGTGDITNLENVKYFKDKFNFTIDLFTSDCGLLTRDAEGFSNQELNMSILNYCQCLIALETLKVGGHGIFKIFLPMGSSVSISIIYLMSKYFDYIYFIKQFSGSSGSSEIYMVCKNKKYHLEDDVRKYLYNCLTNYDKTKALFPENMYDSKFLDQLLTISKEFVKKTVKTIKRSLYYYDNVDILKKHKPLINDAKQVYGKIWCRDVDFKVLDKSLML